MKKGDMMLGIVFVLVLLVVALSLAEKFFGQNQKDPGYLGLPEGCGLEFSSADTLTFVPPPLLWFEDPLTKGESQADYRNAAYLLNPDELILLGTHSIKLERKGILGTPTLEPDTRGAAEIYFEDYSGLHYDILAHSGLLPTAAVYPILTDSFENKKSGTLMEPVSISGGGAFALNLEKPFGKINVHFTLDTRGIEKRLMEDRRIRLAPETEGLQGQTEYQNIIEEQIYLKICWSALYPDGYGSEKCFRDNEKGIKLSKLKEDSICSHGDGSNSPIEDLTKYYCRFEFDIAEKCCPVLAAIAPSIIGVPYGESLSKDSAKEIKTEPEMFGIAMIYYMELLSNQDALFSDFEGVSDTISGVDSRKQASPLSNIFIYPCRAKISGYQALNMRGISSPANEKIDWSSCRDSEEFVDSGSGWRCKTDGSSNYYIFNPYAYCPLEGNSLPSNPLPIYLEGTHLPSGEYAKKRWFIIPDSKSKEYSWDLAKKAIDVFYGAGFFSEETLAPYSPSDGSPQDPSAEDENPDQPALEVPEFWAITGCSYECSRGTCLAGIKKWNIVGNDNPESENYICKSPHFKSSGIICGSEPKGCLVTLSMKASPDIEEVCACI
jgi:hypothetical protein